MSQQFGRYTATSPFSVAEGWSLRRLTPPSRLFGANGMTTGKDGRIYVAQVAGSQVSAINVDTGEIEAFSPKGAGITAPDDLVFDEAGNLYCTEITEGRVSMRTPKGDTRVLYDNLPVANPITFHQGHLIAGELRMGGRIVELDRNSGAARVIVENVPMANAFQVGPDGKLYFPAQAANEIWRVSLDGGAPEVVAKDLGVPDSVKFDSKGMIISTQVGSGQVLRIDPRTGAKTVLADIGPGLDNSTFVGDRLFISHITGSVHELLGDGKVRALVEKGLQWPMGLAMGADGVLRIADGMFIYEIRPGGKMEQVSMLFLPGYPGFIRGVADGGDGQWVVTTANGDVVRYWPTQQKHEFLASGYDRLMGVAVAPGGAIVCAESGGGRVLSVTGSGVTELARGLKRPMGVAISADGACFVAEADAGRVVKLSGGKSDTVLDGLKQPEGIAIHAGKLYVIDVLTKELIESDLNGGARRSIASGVPVGAPQGVIAKPLGGVGDMCGPMLSFAGIAAGADGTLYVSADAEGSVLAIQPA